MIADIVGEVVGGVLRFLGRIVLEVVFELLVKGTGSAICQPFIKKKLDPDGWLVVVVGLSFWGAVGIGLYAIKRQF
jgi:hypothetical protein